jgi:hypothetical protein
LNDIVGYLATLKKLAPEVLIQLVAEAPDRGSVNGDIDRALVSVAIQHDFAADLGKRRALQQKPMCCTSNIGCECRIEHVSLLGRRDG